MPRERLCRVCGGWHSLDRAWPHNCASHDIPKRANHLSVPMVLFDTMDPVESMTNGKTYDSKAALRSEYKRAGVIEVGNDGPTERATPKKPDRAAIKAAVRKAASRAGLGA